MILQALNLRRVVQCRKLGLYEYEAMDLLEKNRIMVPKRFLVKDGTDLSKIYGYMAQYQCNYFRQLTNDTNNKIVVKAQVLTGGRGKGVFNSGLQGGVKIADG